MSTSESLLPPFVTSFRVRYADTDCEGVAYYGSYLMYFEVARVELLRELGCPIKDVRARGWLFPAVDATVRYHRPALVDDLLAVELRLGKLGKASFGFIYQVVRDREVLASGSTRHAAVDVTSRKAMALPPWFVDLWQRAQQLYGGAL